MSKYYFYPLYDVFTTALPNPQTLLFDAPRFYVTVIPQNHKAL